MKIQAKKLRDDAKLPEYAHPGDAGMDVFGVVDVILQPGERKAVETGVAIALPEGTVGLVWDKSGRAVKEGLSTMAGVIDSGYRGEVKIVLLNASQEPITIEKGQKIAQVLVQSVVAGEIQPMEELDDTVRGDGGFGSTGL